MPRRYPTRAITLAPTVMQEQAVDHVTLERAAMQEGTKATSRPKSQRSTVSDKSGPSVGSSTENYPLAATKKRTKAVPGRATTVVAAASSAQPGITKDPSQIPVRRGTRMRAQTVFYGFEDAAIPHYGSQKNRPNLKRQQNVGAPVLSAGKRTTAKSRTGAVVELDDAVVPSSNLKCTAPRTTGTVDDVGLKSSKEKSTARKDFKRRMKAAKSRAHTVTASKVDIESDDEILAHHARVAPNATAYLPNQLQKEIPVITLEDEPNETTDVAKKLASARQKLPTQALQVVVRDTAMSRTKRRKPSGDVTEITSPTSKKGRHFVSPVIAVTVNTPRATTNARNAAKGRKERQRAITLACVPDEHLKSGKPSRKSKRGEPSKNLVGQKPDFQQPMNKKRTEVTRRNKGAVQTGVEKERFAEGESTGIAARIKLRQRYVPDFAAFSKNIGAIPRQVKRPVRRKVTRKLDAGSFVTHKPTRTAPVMRLTIQRKPVEINSRQKKPRSSVEIAPKLMRLSMEGSGGIQRDSFGFLKCSVNHVIKKKYLILETLGTGTFGSVMKVRDVFSGQRDASPLALKIVRQDFHEAAIEEVEMLQHVGSLQGKGKDLFVRLFDNFDYHGHICMVFEVLGKSVYSVLEENKYHPYKLNQVRNISYQLCAAVAFLHSRKIVHTDLKPENLLFCDSTQAHSMEDYFVERDGLTQLKVMRDTRIKLIDFGAAVTINNGKEHRGIVTTRHYRPPEVVLGKKWVYPLDVWSTGCIMFELYTGAPLCSTEDDAEHLAIMERALGPLPKSLTANSKLYSSGKLKWNPSKESEGYKYVKNNCRPLNDHVRDEDKSDRDVWSLFYLIERMLKYVPYERVEASIAAGDSFFEAVDPDIRHWCNIQHFDI
ncbi:uncharacterized protein LOC129581310 isoform X2 [Paramacrobiotus metropolitanus]|uniref:uncharacterized protein LOC129581310 isoform X2 n=1 Tax=Paramacrobiotus metropolitanus TaxID=2943436 RepID=UPI0024459AB3|nr:uncharacterized protein LOC129581310 isoform X2 [Paramacrobiotus metropolitanus]